MDERIKEIENEKTKEIMDSLLDSEFRESLEQLEIITKGLGISDEKLLNIGILCNNKIFEINHKFHEKGLSMFARIDPKTGEIEESVIGNAIICMLYEYVSSSIEGNEEDEVIKNQTANSDEKKEDNKWEIFSFLGRIFGANKKRRELEARKQKLVKEVASKVAVYKEVCDMLYEYNLEDCLVETLSFYLDINYSDIEREQALYGSVIPDMIKLGYIGKVTQLKERLKESRSKTWDVDYIIKLVDGMKYMVVKNDSKEMEIEILSKDIR